MLNRNKGPRGGLVVWLMAVIVISLAPAMHPIAADIAVLSLTAYAIERTAVVSGSLARPSFAPGRALSHGCRVSGVQAE